MADERHDSSTLVEVYRLALVTRAMDERLWAFARQGRAGFVLTGRGHEVAQIASAMTLRLGHDWAWPYYRDLGVGIALGVTPYEVFLGALARADDPHTGGRQLTGHLSSRELRIGSVSSAVGAHVPHAVGAAYAARVFASDAVAMCWFGDGAASEGAVHEAMNLAAAQRLPVVFVCENNGWAISVPLELQMGTGSVADRAGGYGMPADSVDGTDAPAVLEASRHAVERARRADGPSLLELHVPRIGPHSSQDDDSYRRQDDRAALAAADPISRLGRELLEGGVLTPEEDRRLVDEVRALVDADAERALSAAEPAPSRARRWLYADADASPIAPDASPIAPDAAPDANPSTVDVRMIEAIRDAIREEMGTDERVVVLGEDVGRKGGVFKATSDLSTEFGPLRVLDTPVSEIAIAGTAIGAAVAGLRPVAEFQFADYLHPAYDQIVNQAATMRWRSVGAWGVPAVFRAPIGAGVNGGVYHSQSPEAPYCHTPGLKVVVPSTPRDAKGLLRSAIRDPDPVLFFEHKLLYRRGREYVPPGELIPLGVARLDREGSTLSIVTYGIGVHHAREAADRLLVDGIAAEILDLRTLVPLDRDAVAATVRRTARVLIVHEANRTMGFGAEIAAFVAEELFGELDAPVIRVAADDCHLPYNTPEERAIIPSAQSVADAARRLAAY